jgi:hypothetical protein
MIPKSVHRFFEKDHAPPITWSGMAIRGKAITLQQTPVRLNRRHGSQRPTVRAGARDRSVSERNITGVAMKAIALLCTIAVAAVLTAQPTEADARMLGMGGSRMMGGFHRPMLQPTGPMRSGLTVAPRPRGFWPTIGNFEVKRSPARLEVFDYTGRYQQRFDGGTKGGAARGVGSNETITIHGGRTETTGSGFLLDGGGFRGGVGVAASGKSSTWIRVSQPHTGTGSASRHVRHRMFAIVDRTN